MGGTRVVELIVERVVVGSAERSVDVTIHETGIAGTL